MTVNLDPRVYVQVRKVRDMRVVATDKALNKRCPGEVEVYHVDSWGEQEAGCTQNISSTLETVRAFEVVTVHAHVLR